ncbi:MAG: DUF481 domain-containing protein [Candidatus Brocadia sp.]|nr:DUF481 domain-containing protein [Candidatus Brocadia sp.]
MKRKSIYGSTILLIFLLWSCPMGMDKVYSDEIKTIDGSIVAGEVVEVNEEYLSVKQGQGRVISVPWHNTSLISREKEIIIVTREGNKNKFSILTNPSMNMSAKDTNLRITDKLSDIFPSEKIVASAPTTQGTEQPIEEAKQIAQATTEQSAQEGVQTAQAVSAPAAPPPKTWKGNVDAGANIKDGNTESTTTHVKGAFSNERKRDNIYFNALIMYETVTDQATDEDQETVNEQRATGKYEYKHTPRLYSFFNQYFEHDELESLNYRSISSPGAGYRLIDKERLKYKTEAGPAYTYERFHGDITDEFLGIRIGQYLDWIIWTNTKFYAKSEYVQSVEDTNDWRIDSGVGVRHNLTKSIALNLEFLDQYDNTPAEGKEKEDTTFIGSIGYNF